MVSAALILAFTSAPPARAQSNDYKSLTNAAVEEHSLGHYEEARALFTRAHAINPSARTFWGMGIAAFEARQYVDAIGLLKQARDDTRKPLTAAQRKQTDSLLERAQAFVVRVPIRVEPASAKVTVDGREPEPDADGVVLLDVGTHQVLVSAEGYQDVVRVARWEAGNAPVFELRLEKKAAPGAPEPAPAVQPAALGAPGRPAQSEPSATPSSYRVLKWVSLGAALASLGITGAGIGLRESEAARYNDDSECPPPDRDAACPGSRQTVKKWQTMAVAGGAATGIFAALTVAFFVLDRKPKNEGASARTRCGPAFVAGALCEVRF
jgi:tetratricopeptide (TPR) repeat protein